MWSAVVLEHWRAAALIDYIDIISDIILQIKRLFADSLVADRMPARAAVIEHFLRGCDNASVTNVNLPICVYANCTNPPIVTVESYLLTKSWGEIKLIHVKNGKSLIYIVIDYNKLVANLARFGCRIQQYIYNGFIFVGIQTSNKCIKLDHEEYAPW